MDPVLSLLFNFELMLNLSAYQLLLVSACMLELRRITPGSIFAGSGCEGMQARSLVLVVTEGSGLSLLRCSGRPS